MSSIYVNDVGTELIVDTKTDISTATVMRLLVKSPSGDREWVCTKYDKTSIIYITQTNDLDVPGTYTIQAYIEMPGWKGRGERTSFTVIA